MKIQWLNEEMTEAIVTRGWWKKKEAHVGWVSKPKYAGDADDWNFMPTNDRCPYWLESALDRARRRDKKRSNWHPVGSLPTAKLLKG